MSALITFDTESAVATITLADWPRPLVDELGSYFDVSEGVLRLDYSHLPGAREQRFIGGGWESQREGFASALQAAALKGRIELTAGILLDRSRVLENSTSITDKEAYRRAADHLEKDGIPGNFWALRDAMATEITPAAKWVRWLLASNVRSNLLADQEIMTTLVSRTSDSDCAICLGLVAPNQGESNWAFDRVVREHWTVIRDFIAEQIAKERHFGYSDPSGLIFSLFSSSSVVQESRWACEQVRDHAHGTTFPKLIQHCLKFTADDVRLLLQRMQASDRAEIDDYKLKVAAAYSALGPLLKGPMPSDLALAGLWHEFKLGTPSAATPDQKDVASRIEELSSGSRRTKVLWDSLGPEARGAWRQDLFDRVAGNPELAQGLIDFACLWLDQPDFAEIEPLLLRLIDDEGHLAFVKRRASGSPRQVQLRAMGLARSKLGVPDLEGPVDEDGSRLPSVGAKTWLGDPSAERVIHLAFSRIEEEFCREYLTSWGEDEEAHTSRILTLTQGAAREATHQLRKLSKMTRGRFPTLSVSVRQPTKREEGANTHAGVPLGSDILFLIRIVDKGKTVVERATLVQVKKRSGTGSGNAFSSTIGVDLRQCEDMLSQSEHAYYLFLTPAAVRSTLWVAPARLVRNLTQLYTSKSSILAMQARDASCSYADFFLQQLVGLWAGDERDSVVTIAKGDLRRGRTPRHIVDVEVRRQVD